jgi:DNA-binding MurR/RpiR family transcriptional regulator
MNFDFIQDEIDYINKHANFNKREAEIFSRLTDPKEENGRQSIVKIALEMDIGTATVSRSISKIKKKILKLF